MSKYYILGGLLVVGGLVLICFQAISSMMTAGEIVWKGLSVTSIVGMEHLKWIDGISWHSMQTLVKHIVTMPLYILLICTGIVSLIVGGLIDK